MFTDQFFTFLFAYGIATVCGIIFAEHSSFPALASHFMKAVDTTCKLLPTSLETILHSEVGTEDSSSSSARDEEAGVEGVPGLVDPSARVKQQELAKQLRSQIRGIQQTHKDYSLDIVHARHHPKALTPVIRELSRLQRNPLLGPTGHVPGDRIRAALERTYASPLFHRSTNHSPIGKTPRRSLSRHSLASAVEGAVIVPSPSQLSLELNRLTEIRGGPRSLNGSIRGSSSIRTEVIRPDSPGRDNARFRLKQACLSLTETITAALYGTGNLVAIACDWQGDQAPKDAVHVPELKDQLDRALLDLQKRLGGIVDTIYGADGLARTTSDSHLSARAITFEDELIETDWLDDEDRFRIAFYIIALLDLAKDTRELLNKAEELEQTSGKKRWYFPPIPWPWSPVAPHAAMPSIERVSVPPQDEPQDQPREEDLDYVHKLLHEKRELHLHAREGSLGQRIANAWRLIWDRHAVVMARVWLSKLFYGIKHSRHVHFAVKQTVGICLLSIPGLLGPGQAGRVWYDRSRGPWMVVSFMYVLEVTTGATLRVGFYRMCGTFLGCVTGYVCVLIAHENAYGLVTLGTFFAVPISYGVCFTHFAPMMIVYAITLAPLLFMEYLHLDEGQGIFELSWMRFVDIVIGIAAAILLGSWLWPIHARVQYFSAVGDTMENITDYYLRMSRDLLRPTPVYNANSKQYRVLERRARANIARCRTLQSVQQREIGLLPRPTKLYGEIVDLLERLLETFGEIRTLRFSLPRKATVLDVLPIRRELVSSILVNLWACGQAFRSRAPLPQVFPSPRNPLSEVMETTDDYAREVRQMRAREKHRRMRDSTDGEREGGQQAYHAELGVLYAMAENEALTEAINCIDEVSSDRWRELTGTDSGGRTHTVRDAELPRHGRESARCEWEELGALERRVVASVDNHISTHQSQVVHYTNAWHGFLDYFGLQLASTAWLLYSGCWANAMDGRRCRG